MVHYRHRRYWGVAPPMLAAALAGGLVYAMWGEPWEEWVAVWPMALFALALWGWYWFLVGRYISRRVEVADDGLWIDGEWQVGAGDIVAVGLAQDPLGSAHLRRVDGGSYWLQRSWVRVIEVEGLGKVAVPRSRDYARGSGWHAVLVVSKRAHGRGHAADYRKGWLVGTYRDRSLVEAIQRVSPEARFIETEPALGRPA